MPAKLGQKETIAVLGTGDMGGSFGPSLAKLGYKIIYGSRSPESDRVAALINRTGHGALAATNEDAARQADLVLLALPWRPMETILESAGELEGKIIIDLTWPDYRIAEDGYDQMTMATSGAEQIQQWLPKALVVKAFGTLGSYVIDTPDAAGGPVSVPIASDHRYAKEVTAKIAE